MNEMLLFSDFRGRKTVPTRDQRRARRMWRQEFGKTAVHRLRVSTRQFKRGVM